MTSVRIILILIEQLFAEGRKKKSTGKSLTLQAKLDFFLRADVLNKRRVVHTDNKMSIVLN